MCILVSFAAWADDARPPVAEPDDVRRLRSECSANPTDSDVRVRLGNALLAARRPAEADEVFVEALSLHPASSLAKLGRARAAQDRGRWDEATRLFQQAVDSDPPTAEAFRGLIYSLTRGGVRSSVRGTDQLRTAIDRALALPVEFQCPIIWNMAVTHAGRDSQPGLAVSRSLELIRMFPRSAWGPSSLGWSLRIQGKDKDADAAYARVEALLPKDRFEVQMTKLRLPFSGQWQVVQGPSGAYSHHGVRSRYAWDFRALNDLGQTHSGDGSENSDYPAFGAPVLAAADGWVVDFFDGADDNPPNRSDRLGSGNFLVLEHTSREHSVYNHLQKGSVRVKVGERVNCGERVAACGNSGFSRAPHLHFVLCTGRPPEDVARPAVFHRYIRTRKSERLVVSDGSPEYAQVVEHAPE